ncbi:MAG: AMP-dependent synthetase/ligase [Aquabacterium sp.]|nr:AMP-dependent synthetase/ligase [Aquabacterium sp.]
MPPSTAPSWHDKKATGSASSNSALDFADFESAPAKLFQTATKLGQHPAYWEREDTGWKATSWTSYADEVRTAARALLALGVERGDAVAILSFNCPAWSITAFAAMSIGAIPVGIYWTSPSTDIEYVLNHCKAPVLIVEDTPRLAKVDACMNNLMHLRSIIRIKGEPSASTSKTALTWQSFMTLGRSDQAAIQNQTISKRLSAITPTDTGTLIYTSGTTGPSKAVVLSHGNIWWTATTMIGMFHADEHDRLLSYLPLAHIAEQLGSMHNQAYTGFSVYFARSIDMLGEHLKEVKPTIFFGVPRVWEKMQAAIEGKLSNATGFKAKMATWAMDVGRRWHELDMEGRPTGPWLAIQKSLAQRLVYRKVQEALGFDQARLLSTGAAAISPDSLRFFAGLNIVVRELYGQSEACGPSTISLPNETRVGSVGKPLPGTQIRVADDGELFVRGPHVFQGYLGQPNATAQTMQDGWLMTGDLGHIDEDGFVYITGRKKDLIITSGGKNISPANIEAALMDCHLIEFAVVCGDGRHYLTALITLEMPTLLEFARKHGLSDVDLHAHPLVLEAIQQGIDHVNDKQARVAHIRKFVVLTEPFTIEGGELTATLKVKRKVVLDRHQALIQSLYAS